MKRPSYSREDVALAYELRLAGCCWKLIGYGLGCGEHAIRKAVKVAIRRGLS